MEPASLEKPRTELYRPALVRLPRPTLLRRFMRWIFRIFSRLAVFLVTRCRVIGLDRFPRSGPVLIVTNHLGDADVVVAAAFFPRQVDALAKSDLYDFPMLGKFMEAYGVIWVHRGIPDRKALRAALGGLAEGRAIAIAPEARESLTGALEEGTGGAAFIALRAGVPVVPVAFTGTENALVVPNLKRLRRTDVTMTVGEPFMLDNSLERKEAVEKGTEMIMSRLAAMLPPEYQGVYAPGKNQL